MRIPRSLLALAALLAAGSCGDNHTVPDAPVPDARPEPIPDPPRIGMQIERMGRPAINTALIGLRDVSNTATMKKDIYNGLSDPSVWGSASIASGRSVVTELAGNLGILDILDKGNVSIPGVVGCGNQLLYNGNPGGGGPAGATSYHALAAILADDMLYVDTSKTTCTSYLSLELEAATGGALEHSQCGGRTPTHDVIDVSLSALISGLNGFTSPPALLPRISDGVAAHADLSDTEFPYFGAPH
ncbi:MAG TPA: DUF4331 family protein [Kofleriaceae bacterium]|nr:DUF4331 family protein [Kofleriaceae bacterium]